MSSSMLSPTNPAYRADAPKGGILLNAIRPYPQSVPKSPSTSTSYTTPSSPSSSDSASGSDDLAPKSQQKKRITFAPLPNPRAQDDIPVIVFDHASDKLYENPEAASSSSGDDNPAVILPDPTTRSPQLSAKKASTWSHSTKKLLKPFYKPLQKSDNTDGGALGLFRSSSRDSTASSVGTLTDSGAPLARRMSTGSSPFDVGRTGPDRSGLALHPVTSENGGVATGTRMLNGRVYGGSRYRSAVQKKEVEKEPEFVEWGYGGMGSNRGSSASSTYARVQSSHTNAVAAEDDDDGSGMGWVRRRREAREQEKRERDEREAKEQEGAAALAAAAAATEPTPTTAAVDAQSATPTHDDSSAAAHPDSVSPPVDASEHITQAVRIPSGHHHHPKPSASRRSSEVGSGRNTPIAKPNNDSTPTVTSLPHSTVPSVGSSLRMSATAEQAQSSEDSESDEESTEREDEPREEDDDEEDEEESEDDANMRKTSVCAGVEKISRHKE
ncbi:hypothetical protein M407DRAFT_209040 [Tulasnella calospora MUT 4182]|uniref:Uncharacterized protein n=1 Tax=Tulasnella calospora MUT 4182 TaxID=1051891 RepID=A0A0C3QI66_9AGAM|nr:hypothetical protein M407DRAFT_209040 [Tulasnella calospora MUT 4182]